MATKPAKRPLPSARACSSPSRRLKRKPLAGCVFYLGLDRHTDAEKEPLIEAIADLGGDVEGFYSNKITHLVLEDIVAAQGDTLLKEATGKTRATKRGNAKSALVNLKLSSTTLKIYQAAKDTNKVIWDISTLRRYTGINTALSTKSKVSRPPKDYHFLTGVFFVLADSTGKHRPIIVKQYMPDEESTYPKLHYNTLHNHPPFTPPEPEQLINEACLFLLAPKQTFSIAQIPPSDTPQLDYLDDKRRRRQRAQRPSFRKEHRKIQESALFRSRTEKYVRAHPKPGYCEHCSDKFDCFIEHLQSQRHREIISKAKNWVQLDALLQKYARALPATCTNVMNTEIDLPTHMLRKSELQQSSTTSYTPLSAVPSFGLSTVRTSTTSAAVSLENNKTSTTRAIIQPRNFESILPTHSHILSTKEPSKTKPVSKSGAEAYPVDDAISHISTDEDLADTSVSLIEDTEIDEIAAAIINDSGRTRVSTFSLTSQTHITNKTLLSRFGNQTSTTTAHVPFSSALSDSDDAFLNSLFDSILTEENTIAETVTAVKQVSKSSEADELIADLDAAVLPLLPPPLTTPIRQPKDIRNPSRVTRSRKLSLSWMPLARSPSLQHSSVLAGFVSSFISPRVSSTSRTSSTKTDDLTKYSVMLPSLSSARPLQSEPEDSVVLALQDSVRLPFSSRWQPRLQNNDKVDCDIEVETDPEIEEEGKTRANIVQHILPDSIYNLKQSTPQKIVNTTGTQCDHATQHTPADELPCMPSPSPSLAVQQRNDSHDLERHHMLGYKQAHVIIERVKYTEQQQKKYYTKIYDNLPSSTHKQSHELVANMHLTPADSFTSELSELSFVSDTEKQNPSLKLTDQLVPEIATIIQASLNRKRKLNLISAKSTDKRPKASRTSSRKLRSTVISENLPTIKQDEMEHLLLSTTDASKENAVLGCDIVHLAA